jgi:hypothetical protein
MMNRTRFRVLLIDPPGDDEPQIDAFGDDGPQIEEGERPRKTGIRSWEIPNSEKFELATRSVSQAKALAFSGFDDAAAKKMANLYERRRAVRRSAPRRTVGTENEFGRFSGVQESIIVQEGVRVEIFQGLDETLRNAYLRDDRDEIVAVHDRVAAVAIAKHPDSTLRGFAVGRDQRFDTRILRSVGPDGTLLEIRLTPG